MADDLDVLAAVAREAHASRIREVGGTALGHEAYRRIASAVAAQAVADAKLHNQRLEVQVFALAAHLPAIRRALTLAAAEAEYEAEAKQYRAAIQALGLSEEGADHA